MKKITAIIFIVAALLVIYKMQHIKPVDDPKDSPIFPQRLKSSLDRFQENKFPDRLDKTQAERKSATKIPPYSRSTAQTKDLVVTGRCGRLTLTWVEEKKIDKESIIIKRKIRNGKFSLLKGNKIYDRAEEGGTRYWSSDSKLTDGASYEYLISFNDAAGKEMVKGPVSINLTCNEKDREILARREKMLKEYYQNKGIKGKDYPAKRTPSYTRSSFRAKDLIVTGRCGRLTLTWVEEEKIEKESIKIKRKTRNEEYSLLKGKMIYEREEEGGGIRYWASDSGLSDGIRYEYRISFKDPKGKEVVKGPASISLTCNERDKEILAQRDKMLKEYYQKRGIKENNYAPMRPPSYQISKEAYNIELGNSPRKGREDARVTLVVFTDFECIHCSTWAETLDTMIKTFPQDVRIVFKNFPLPYHRHSEIAAMAALAAGEQGKFWEIHDILFKNYNALSKEDITGYAKALGLNISNFINSLDSKKIKKRIDQDKTQGKSLGVQNVPTTFVNGRRLVGSPPVSYLKEIIEDILKK